MKYYLAIDLGASSGRHVIGYLDNGKIVLEEIHRFKTCMDESNNGLVWDIPRLFNEIKIGIKKAFVKYKDIESLSIDTWGVDYVLMNEDKEIPPFYAYRNERCLLASEEVHKIIPFKELYKKTGIQFAPFNTVYQLFDDKQKGRLKEATDYLMLPSYFTYKLTGQKVHEYTNESTGALLNPYSNEYEASILNKLGIPNKLFKNIVTPGYFAGYLLEDIQKEVGGNTKVIMAPSHDTASAFEAVDNDEETIILSSGTWSLLGIKSKEVIINEESLRANYTNEGGVNYIRFLKNIMGMYLVNRVIDETGMTFELLAKELPDSKYCELFDVNDASLSAPKNMKSAILNLLKDKPPKNDIDLFASIYHSMALGYKKAINELERIVNKKYKKIIILGGGAKNNYLNQLVKKYTDKEVIPLPVEATSLGNIKTQMKASKEL